MISNNLTALVIGATGATGSELVKQLLLDANYLKVKIFIRKQIDLDHPKLEKHLMDFDHIEKYKEHLSGDILFSMMGTTLKQAGSKEKQYKIDYTYQYDFAKYAEQEGVKTYILTSASNANANSNFFYPKIKGQLEDAVVKLNFESIHIFQPGILDRHANDGRSLESFSVNLLNTLNKFGLLKSMKPMPVSVLTAAMRAVVQKNTNEKIHYYKLNEIFSIEKS